MPVLETRPVPSRWPAETPDALIFTSVNGVRYHQPQPELLGCPVFAVGDRTARAASAAGYRDVRSAKGDVRNLEELVCSAMLPGRRILHLGARQPAGDLVGKLTHAGHEATRLVVYATHPVSADVLTHMLPPMKAIDGILIHSPRGGRTVRSYLDHTGAEFDGSIYCISCAAAAPFAGFSGARVLAADQPTEEAMLQLMDDPRG